MLCSTCDIQYYCIIREVAISPLSSACKAWASVQYAPLLLTLLVLICLTILCLPRTAGTGIDISVDSSTGSGVGDRAGVSCSTGLSDAWTADPFGLIHHCACMRQATDIPHLHQQVASRFEDVNRLIMADDDKALSIHLQDLLTHLQQTRLTIIDDPLDRHSCQVSMEDLQVVLFLGIVDANQG